MRDDKYDAQYRSTIIFVGRAVAFYTYIKLVIKYNQYGKIDYYQILAGIFNKSQKKKILCGEPLNF